MSDRTPTATERAEAVMKTALWSRTVGILGLIEAAVTAAEADARRPLVEALRDARDAMVYTMAAHAKKSVLAEAESKLMAALDTIRAALKETTDV